MDTVTDPGAAAPAAVKPSIQDELAAAFAAESAPAPVVAETVEPPVAAPETPKAEEKPPETSLSRRLAMVAAAEKARKADEAKRAQADKDQKARDDEMRPLIERVKAAKSAKSKMEAAKIALELDDEGVAELFLELHKHHEGSESRPKDPTADLDKLVMTRLDAALKARDEADKARRDKEYQDARDSYAGGVLEVLGAKGEEWPLVEIAVPSKVDITEISDAWLLANGELPSAEAVLKLIQDERQEKLDKRRAAAEAKTSKTTAPVKAGETSGAKPKPPVASNDVPVSPPKKLSLTEELLAAFKSGPAA